MLPNDIDTYRLLVRERQAELRRAYRPSRRIAGDLEPAGRRTNLPRLRALLARLGARRGERPASVAP